MRLGASVQLRKYFRVLNTVASSSPAGFAKNLPLSLILRASVFVRKKLATAKHYFLIAPETRLHLTGSDTA
jgi:hypothetical protein